MWNFKPPEIRFTNISFQYMCLPFIIKLHPKHWEHVDEFSDNVHNHIIKYERLLTYHLYLYQESRFAGDFWDLVQI